VKLVAGLGNPGKQYAETRHNTGFRVVEVLASRWGFPAGQAQYGSLISMGSIRQEKVALVRPNTFMNLSGQPLASISGYYKVDLANLIVVHDDLELPAGVVRIKQGGGHGGHNGLRSINQQLGPDYLRVRVGVGRPPEGWDTAAFVLQRLDAAGLAALDQAVDAAADAVEAILRDGPIAAMNTLNTRAAAGPVTGGPSAALRISTQIRNSPAAL